MSKVFNFDDAIRSLRPAASYGMYGLEYSGIEWTDQHQTKPTESELQAEVVRLQAEYDANTYQHQRAAEYPPITDYLDGVVKGDQAQIDAYIAACQAVKAKYPKG